MRDVFGASGVLEVASGLQVGWGVEGGGIASPLNCAQLRSIGCQARGGLVRTM